MIWKIIRIAMVRCGITNIAELAERSGINPATLTQTRRRDPGSFRLYELTQLDKVLGFTPTEWGQIKESDL